uniref:Uncharacterized protein n=1 Tax=Fagus sylvatica TaxID=28930 RepID=A0A2N9GH88_FAGSY
MEVDITWFYRMWNKQRPGKDQNGGLVGGLGLVETRDVESGTGGVMVKAVEVAWLEPVVHSGGGKTGIGGARWRWEGWNRWC